MRKALIIIAAIAIAAAGGYYACERFGLGYYLSFPSPRPSSARSGDHLDPENSRFMEAGFAFSELDRHTQYETMVINAFAEAFGDDVRLRVIEMPSFVPESATGIREKPEGQFQVFHLVPEKQLWNYVWLDMLKSNQDGDANLKGEIDKFERGLPPDFRNLKLKRCEAPISAERARKLMRLWKEMLLQTGYDRPKHIDEPMPATGGLDGTVLHFSMRDGYQVLAGQKWTPDEGTRVGLLTQIVFTMRTYCAHPDDKTGAKLDGDIDALAKRLR